MDHATLVEQLRDGYAWKHADGLVARPESKTEATADQLLQIAATCHACGRRATTEEVEQAVNDATDLDSYMLLVANRIEHAPDCMT
tara:strand:- start:35726 stop:35983 length:258 start_codon:yes stop_codon:yes gene_type:complete